MGNVAKEQYDSIIDSIINLLNGTDRRILDEMENTMHLAAEKFDFETAAKYRDYISAVSYLLSREKVIEFTEENKNIVFLEILRDNNVKFFLIKGNRMLFNNMYKLDSLNVEQLKTAILISYKNKELNSDLKVDKNGIDEAQIIYSYLKNSNCTYVILPDKWLKKDNSIALEKALAKLINFPEKK